MNEELMEQMKATAERLATAAEALDRVLGKLDAQQETLNAKVDRIVAAVEETCEVRGQRSDCRGVAAGDADGWGTQDRSQVSHNQGDLGHLSNDLQARVAELEKSNADLKAQAGRLARKTLSPVVSALLAKNEIEGERLDAAVLDKTLAALSVEQRIAVKSELARAGMIE